MKKDVFQKIEVLTSQVRGARQENITSSSGTVKQAVNSLADNTRSKEQADSLKKMLTLLRS